MIRKLILAGIGLIGIALVALAFFNPILRIILGISGSLSSTTFGSGKAILHTLRNGVGLGISGIILGTFIGFGLAVVGLILAVVGAFARSKQQIGTSTS